MRKESEAAVGASPGEASVSAGAPGGESAGVAPGGEAGVSAGSEADVSAGAKNSGDPKEAKASKGGRNLWAATAVGVVLLGAFGGSLLFYLPLFGLLAVSVLVAALVEFSHALSGAGLRLAMPVMVTGGVGIFVCAWLLGLEAMLAASLLTVAVALLWHLTGPVRGEELLRDITASALTVAYLPFLGSFIALMTVECGGKATVVFILAVTLGSDTGGYVFGRLLGKHKMTPVISPKKTWEGLGGSVLFAVIICVAGVFWIGIPWWFGLLLGPVIALMGTVGDLSESLMKRELGLKDMGNLLPGHGGILDRLDSILMSVPLAYILLRIALHIGEGTAL